MIITRNDELIGKAYERFCDERDQKEDEIALNTLNDLHQHIDAWDGNTNKLKKIGFFEDYLVGPNMESIATKGKSTASTENFKHVMRSKTTAIKTAELFQLRKDGPLTEGLVHRITDIQMIDHVNKHKRQTGANSNVYIHRFLLTIFIEIMTTITNLTKLRKTAKLLGIPTTGASFEKLQVQIRSNIEDSLKKQGLGQELTKFTRAKIAGHVIDAVDAS